MDRIVDRDTVIKMAESDCKSGVKNFADKIYTLRKSYKITMADLSSMSGVPSSTISDVEKAKYIPNLDIILKLGYALKLSKDEIFDLLKLANPKIATKNGAISMIKCGLASLDVDANVINEIIDFIEFKSRLNMDAIHFYK